MSDIIQIENKELVVKEWQGERVVTIWDIANLHEREVKRVTEQFKRNKDNFIEGVDFILLSREEFLKSHLSTLVNLSNNTKVIPLFTESGYLMLIKTFNDSLSWKVQRVLVNSYFKIKEIVENNYKVPKTFKEALLLAVEQQEEIERLELENKEKQNQLEKQKPKVDFYNSVKDSESTLDFKQVATTLNFKNIGRNNLMKILRGQRILTPKNEPYQRYINLGYFKTIESDWVNNYGETKIRVKTVVYQKGVEFINNLLSDLGFVKEVGKNEM